MTKLTSEELAFVEHYLYNLMKGTDSPPLRWTARTGTTGIDIGHIVKEGYSVLVAEGREPLFEEPVRLYAEPWASREEAMARDAELAKDLET
jgi:hypothetical protein